MEQDKYTLSEEEREFIEEQYKEIMGDYIERCPICGFALERSGNCRRCGYCERC